MLQRTTTSPARRWSRGPTAPQAGTSVRSTGEPGEPERHASAIADNSVWYSWTPTQTGPAVVRLRDLAGGLDPGFAVYTGAGLGTLTSVGMGRREATFDVVAGTVYRIAVDGFAVLDGLVHAGVHPRNVRGSGRDDLRQRRHERHGGQ